MVMDTSKIKLPAEVTRAIINKVGNTSTIAALSPSTPQLFLNEDYMVFNGAAEAEAEVVAEGQKKSSYEQEASYITGKKFKVQCTTRVTEELKWADEDNRLEIINSIQEDQTKAIARALDYVIYHAIDPKGGTTLTGYDALTANAVAVTDTGDDIANVDALADAVNEYDINGVALSRTWASRLRKDRYALLSGDQSQCGCVRRHPGGHIHHGRRQEGEDRDERAGHHGRLQPHQVGHDP